MMPAGSSAFSIVLVSILAAGIAGMIYAALLAFASINLNADQTIGGTALNLLATALAMVIAKGVNHSASAKLDYSNRAFIYEFGPLTVNVFLFVGIVALILSYIVLYKTRLGLRLRACGEHPQAAGQRGHQCLQDALYRCADLRRTGRHRRHGIHHSVGFQLEL